MEGVEDRRQRALEAKEAERGEHQPGAAREVARGHHFAWRVLSRL